MHDTLDTMTREPFESTPAVLALVALASVAILLTVAGFFSTPEQRTVRLSHLEQARCQHPVANPGRMVEPRDCASRARVIIY